MSNMIIEKETELLVPFLFVHHLAYECKDRARNQLAVQSCA